MAAPAAPPAYYLLALPCTATPDLPAGLNGDENDIASLTARSNLQTRSNVPQDPPPAAELWAKPRPLPRGRQPSHPNVQMIRYACRNLEDLERLLSLQLENQKPNGIAINGTSPGPDAIIDGINTCTSASMNPGPEVMQAVEYTTLEFAFGLSAAFAVTDPLKQQRHVNGMLKGDFFSPTVPHSVVSVLDAMAPRTTSEGKTESLLLQRAIAKACMQRVQRADGFKYTFHNNWKSKDDGAWRFSFYCNDSLLSKGRAATGSKATAGKVPSKPLYDCKGLVSVKFSRAKQCCEVSYRHVPIHKTYEERAPRLRKGTKRWRMLELMHPEKLPIRDKREDEKNPRKRKRQSAGEDLVPEPPRNQAIDGDARVDFMQGLADRIESPGSMQNIPPNKIPPLEDPNLPATKQQCNLPPLTRLCTVCVSQKVRCDGQHPCRECSKRPTFCMYPDSPPLAQTTTTALPPLPSTSLSTQSPPPTPTYTFVSARQGRHQTQAPEEAQCQHDETPSEMERLRAQLAAAEERIRQMETERSLGTVWAPASGAPTNGLP